MQSSFDIEKKNVITIENLSNITLELLKPKEKEKEKLKWFLINKEELENSNIEPVGLKDLTVESHKDKFIFEFNIKDKAKTSIANFVLKENQIDDNNNKDKKEITLEIKED